MPKPSQRADVNTFTGGLITEASPLNFPPNAISDGRNLELNRTGRISRRLGMDFEDNYSLSNSLYGIGLADSLGMGTFRWEAAAGNPNSNFLVAQIGQRLFFYNLNQASVTQGGAVGTLIVDHFNQANDFSFASVDGILTIVAGAEEIATVEYLSGSFNLSYSRILVRDLWGIQETIDPNYEIDPSYRGGLNNQHRYNLMNQSWGIPRKNTDGVLINPIDNFFFNGAANKAPSNAEQVWVGLQFQSVATGQIPFERQYINLYDDSLGAKTNAAKGYFIIDALRRGQGRADAVNSNNAKYTVMNSGTDFPADYSSYGATCIAQFAGRIFYAGFDGQVTGGDARSPNLANYIFFSQLTKNKLDINRCYQAGDPSSRDDSEIVDTDGGFVRISGATKIIGLRALGLSLMVFAENGIWMVTGGDVSSGFSATNYKVSKLSSFGTITDRAIIVENDAAFYWANDGIYSVAKNQYGDYGVTSMSLTTIQQFYQSIPNTSKKGAFGDYDEINKKLRWVYRTGTSFSDESRSFELVFDSQLGAFTVNNINRSFGNSVELGGIFRTQLFIQDNLTNPVFASVDQVFASIDDVVVPFDRPQSQAQFLRYLTLVNQGGVLCLTVSSYKDPTYYDWKSIDGVGFDAFAFCTTGDITAQDSGIDKQIPYLIFSFLRTERGVDTNFQPLLQSSCMFRVQWNFANAIQSNKWTPMRQGYRYRKYRAVESLSDDYDTGFDVIQSKNKVRGRGKAFALYFETEPGKDLQLLGWNITVNADQIT